MPADHDTTEALAQEPLVIFDDLRFDMHDPGYGHPERPERLPSIRQALEGSPWPRLKARPATVEELELVHTPRYIDLVMRARGQSVWLDPDTSTSAGSVDAALLAVGAGIEAAALTLRGPNTFVLARPPAHHACPDRAMGFCLFNGTAIAAAWLATRGKRVAVVDPDVHHGNGTQEAFHRRNDIFYASWHRFPFYPGTGPASDWGRGPGKGYTLNIPLPVGSDDGFWMESLRELVLPMLERFGPDVVVMSLGFDAMETDLLGGMALSSPALAHIVHAMTTRWSVVAFLEGGYNVMRLGTDALESCHALAGEPPLEINTPVYPSWSARVREWEHPFRP